MSDCRSPLRALSNLKQVIKLAFSTLVQRHTLAMFEAQFAIVLLHQLRDEGFVTAEEQGELCQNINCAQQLVEHQH